MEEESQNKELTRDGLVAERFQVTHNLLDGSIPSEMAWMTDLQVLGLGRNNFTSTLPTELGELAALGM
jgi:hypothetical protein